MNPCPCGYAGDPRGRCHCTAEQIIRYRNRLSGPLIDRIDMHVELTPLPVEHLLSDLPPAERSESVAARVAAARNVQMARQGKLNSRLTPTDLARHCPLQRESRVLLAAAVAKLGLSARAFHRVLKLARTCADMAQVADIGTHHVSEAVRLRVLDRAIC
jgi:magnesium chelatase family protein